MSISSEKPVRLVLADSSKSTVADVRLGRLLVTPRAPFRRSRLLRRSDLGRAEGSNPSATANSVDLLAQVGAPFHAPTTPTGRRLGTEWAHFKSRAAATASRSVSNKSAYVSSVTFAEVCPSILDNASTFTPELIEIDAQV